MSKIFIYGLVDPRTNAIRYVGKTNNLKGRLDGHIKDRKSNKEKGDWIDGLLEQGKKPKIKTLEVCNSDNWVDREKYWIEHGYKVGWDLLNKTEGGEPGYIGYSCFFDFMENHLTENSWLLFQELDYEHKADIVTQGALTSVEAEKVITNRKIGIDKPELRYQIREKAWIKAHNLMNKLCGEYYKKIHK
jgi:hypothetical protein